MRPISLFLVMALSSVLAAQSSIFAPDNVVTTGGANVIPFGQAKSSPTWSNQRYQCLIPASFANQIPRAIQDLGFVPSQSGINEFGTLTIRMGVTTSTNLSSTFATNLGANPVTVLDVKDHIWSLTASQWTRIGLQKPFVWIPQLGNLVIEVTTTNTGGANASSTGGFRTGNLERKYAIGWSGTPPTTGNPGPSNAALKVELVLSDADLSLFGYSCKGSNGNPTLSYKNTPKLGKLLDIDLSNGPTSGISALLAGFNNARPIFPIDLSPAGAPGCTLYISPDFAAGLTLTNGKATTKFFIPPVPGFLGVRFYQQFVVFDPQANKAGLTLTEYGRILIGQ